MNCWEQNNVTCSLEHLAEHFFILFSSFFHSFFIFLCIFIDQSIDWLKCSSPWQLILFFAVTIHQDQRRHRLRSHGEKWFRTSFLGVGLFSFWANFQNPTIEFRSINFPFCAICFHSKWRHFVSNKHFVYVCVCALFFICKQPKVTPRRRKRATWLASAFDHGGSFFSRVRVYRMDSIDFRSIRSKQLIPHLCFSVFIISESTPSFSIPFF